MQCKKCQLWVCNRGLQQIPEDFLPENFPSFQARGGVKELGISKAKHQGTLEREGEASREENTW